MTAVLLPVVLLVDLSALSAGKSALMLFGLVGAGALVVLVGAKLMRAEELTWLLRRRTE